MATDLGTRTLSLVTRDGELIDIDLGPVTLENAAIRLPQIQSAIRILRDHQTFLESVITASFQPGQTEQRIGDQLYEYKPEAEWAVTNERALSLELDAALGSGQLTEDEYARATQRIVSIKFNHAVLNTVSKRLPHINDYRHRVEGVAKLRVKR